jgi:hypothetical protein
MFDHIFRAAWPLESTRERTKRWIMTAAAVRDMGIFLTSPLFAVIFGLMEDAHLRRFEMIERVWVEFGARLL